MHEDSSIAYMSHENFDMLMFPFRFKFSNDLKAPKKFKIFINKVIYVFDLYVNKSLVLLAT